MFPAYETACQPSLFFLASCFEILLNNGLNNSYSDQILHMLAIQVIYEYENMYS
jgi:hypothetical protein